MPSRFCRWPTWAEWRTFALEPWQQMIAVGEEGAFSCCASRSFAARLARAGPFPDFGALVETARRVWWQECGVGEWLAAFAAHPKIGEHKAASGQHSAAFEAFSSKEQAAAQQSSSADVAEELRAWNQRYADKFGHIFIICARGRPAPDILAALKERYTRLPHEELQQAAREQMKITELRLAALLEQQPGGGSGPGLPGAQQAQRRADAVLHQLAATPAAHGGPQRSPITTHVLDQALGCPAEGLPLALLKMEEASRLYEKVGAAASVRPQGT